MTRTRSRRGRAWRPVALTAAAFAALGVTLAGPAAASGSSGSAAASASAETLAPVMIVLDASGSMNQTDAPGSRIDAAKTAVRNMVDGLPTNAQVGLTVYGTHTGSSDAEKAAGCQDISQLAAVGTVDKSALTTAVDGIEASGYTPIGTSLQKAAAALPAEGPRSVVLVSDGEDTCSPPPPCDIAQQLKQQGVDLVVHTVGFKVDAAARSQLQCIAQATGGTYSDAQDAGSLDTSLDTQVNRALSPYDVQGKKVSGTEGPAGAPPLEPGQYQDTLPNAGDNYDRSGPGKYYAVDLQEGETPYLSATIVPPAEEGTGTVVDQLLTSVVLTAGQANPSDCKFQEFGQTTSVQNKLLTTSVVLKPGVVGGPDWPKGCPTSGTFSLFVNRNFGGDDEMPVEIAYRSEPTADVAGLPGPVSKLASPPLPTPSADVTELAGGASFNSAPELQPGQTVSDTIVYGESRYFKVHVDWGQRLAFRFDTGVIDGLDLLDGVQGRVSAASPVRQELDDVTSSFDAAAAFLGSQATTLSGGSLYPARWTNRETTDDSIAAYALDGDYYVALSVGYATGDSPTTGTIPYTVTLDVTGDPETGPVYAKSTQTTETPTNGAGGNGSATVAPDNKTTQVASEPSAWTTQRTTVVGGAVGVAVLAAVVLGWLLLGRRARPRPATPPIMPPPNRSDWS